MLPHRIQQQRPHEARCHNRPLECTPRRSGRFQSVCRSLSTTAPLRFAAQTHRAYLLQGLHRAHQRSCTRRRHRIEESTMVAGTWLLRQRLGVFDERQGTLTNGSSFYGVSRKAGECSRCPRSVNAAPGLKNEVPVYQPGPTNRGRTYGLHLRHSNGPCQPCARSAAHVAGSIRKVSAMCPV